MSNSAKIFFSTLIALGLCAVVWRYLNTSEFIGVMKNISLKWLVVSSLLFLVYQLLRTFRFSLLANARGSGWQLFNTLCLHSFLNSTLPAGLGEAALVYLLKKLHGLPYPSGAALLLAVRFIDLALFCLLFFLVGVAFLDKMPLEIFLGMCGLLGALVIALILVRSLSKYETSLGNSHRGELQTTIREHLRLFLDTLAEVSNRKIWLGLILYSAGMWFTMYLFFMTIIFCLGYAIPWHNVLMLYLLILPINLLPIKGIGNFGTHEAAWFIALQILGLKTAESAVLGFGSHILFLTVITLTLLIPFSKYFVSTLREKVPN
jgi:uncharacterized protein (TIRG00374 family)